MKESGLDRKESVTFYTFSGLGFSLTVFLIISMLLRRKRTYFFYHTDKERPLEFLAFSSKGKFPLEVMLSYVRRYVKANAVQMNSNV